MINDINYLQKLMEIADPNELSKLQGNNEFQDWTKSILGNSGTGNLGNLKDLGTGWDFMTTPKGIMSGLGTLGDLGSVFTAYKQLGVADKMLDQSQEAFNYQREMTDKNYANSLASYNREVEDYARKREDLDISRRSAMGDKSYNDTYGMDYLNRNKDYLNRHQLA